MDGETGEQGKGDRRICAVVLALLFSAGSCSGPTQGNRSHDLKLTARRAGGAMPELNGAFLYSAGLSNEGGAPVSIEAIPMGGGYAGDGRVFACSLQTWDTSNQRWILRWRSTEFDHVHRRTVTVGVKPGEHLDVCGLFLPSQAGTTGDCARFSFQTRWDEAASLIVYSDTFVIGGLVSGKDRSCVTEDHSTREGETGADVSETHLPPI
jgi:hypothetical protein